MFIIQYNNSRGNNNNKVNELFSLFLKFSALGLLITIRSKAENLRKIDFIVIRRPKAENLRKSEYSSLTLLLLEGPKPKI